MVFNFGDLGFYWCGTTTILLFGFLKESSCALPSDVLICYLWGEEEA
jgi:hypothetical protein